MKATFGMTTMILDMEHPPPRWNRCVVWDVSALVLFDLHVKVDDPGCGRHQCSAVLVFPEFDYSQYRVTRFNSVKFCVCGRLTGLAPVFQDVYRGNDLDAANIAFDEAEREMHVLISLTLGI